MLYIYTYYTIVYYTYYPMLAVGHWSTLWRTSGEAPDGGNTLFAIAATSSSVPLVIPHINKMHNTNTHDTCV